MMMTGLKYRGVHEYLYKKPHRYKVLETSKNIFSSFSETIRWSERGRSNGSVSTIIPFSFFPLFSSLFIALFFAPSGHHIPCSHRRECAYQRGHILILNSLGGDQPYQRGADPTQRFYLAMPTNVDMAASVLYEFHVSPWWLTPFGFGLSSHFHALSFPFFLFGL